MLNQKTFDKLCIHPLILRHVLIFKLCLLAVALFYIFTILHYIAFQSSKTISTDEALELVSKDLRYAEIIRIPRRFSNLKHILLWTPADYPPFIYYEGQRSFLDHNCSYVNCFLTSNRTFLGNVTMFDAIAFNGRKIEKTDFPKFRSPHQKYIFFNMESAEYYPVCSKKFDGFFNWTATHRLDSDIPWTYIIILDKQGKHIGPKRNVDWATMITETNKININIESKNKAAAWFVSNCHSLSKREEFVKKLQNALQTFNLQVDVYGLCGDYSCPRYESDKCNSRLKESYYFYLSLENSFAEDYVTEKLLTALENNVVPIVFGGADYKRFLPPGSYINGRDYNSTELAKLMNQLIRSPEQYIRYFKWRQYYEYVNGPNMCSLCSALNNKTMVETSSVIKDFRSWWHPKYKDRC